MIRDGLWRVVFGGICAGFVVELGRVTHCAPILRNRPTLRERAVWICK